MIVQLVDEEGTVIGTTDITAIRMKTAETNRSSNIPLPPRASVRWTDFENTSLHDSFNAFVENRAMKQGRTEGAILSRLLRFMPPKPIGATWNNR